jgi:hypothetical protein
LHRSAYIHQRITWLEVEATTISILLEIPIFPGVWAGENIEVQMIEQYEHYVTLMNGRPQ